MRTLNEACPCSASSVFIVVLQRWESRLPFRSMPLVAPRRLTRMESFHPISVIQIFTGRRFCIIFRRLFNPTFLTVKCYFHRTVSLCAVNFTQRLSTLTPVSTSTAQGAKSIHSCASSFTWLTAGSLKSFFETDVHSSQFVPTRDFQQKSLNGLRCRSYRGVTS
jgi:hypothetical protein